MSLLDIKNLSVRFGDATAIPVVDGLDLCVEKGEVLAIVGESGSGKSVTAHSILQLLDPAITRIDGSIRAAPDDRNSAKDYTVRRDSTLNPVPGLPGVMR